MLRQLLTKHANKLRQINYHNFAIQPFVLPDLGEKIKEAKVVKWLVSEGDSVEEYDDLAEVTTDKLSTTIPSTYSGKIHRLLVPENDFCEVGQVLLEIDDLGEGETSPAKEIKEEIKEEAKPETKEKENPAQLPEKKPDPEEGNKIFASNAQETLLAVERVKAFPSVGVVSNKLDRLLKSQTISAHSQKPLATPAVRAMAKSMGIDLAKVPTQDPSGRVRKEDLIAYQDKKETSVQVDDVQEQRKKVGETREAPKSVKSVALKVEQGDAFERVEMSQYEQGMVKSMMSSLSVPDFLLHEEFDVTELTLLRQQLNEHSDVKLSLFSLLVKTFSLALKKNPKVNSMYFYDDDPYAYQIHDDHNISIAIASKNGLVAPNIKKVQNLSMAEVQGQITHLRGLADEGKIGRNELTEGTICLTNIGSMAGTYCGPISLPNQTCIVGIGRATTQLKFVGSAVDKMRILRNEVSWSQENFQMREVVYVSFSGDHRVLDGATMAKFSNDWKKMIENPLQLITQLR